MTLIWVIVGRRKIKGMGCITSLKRSTGERIYLLYHFGIEETDISIPYVWVTVEIKTILRNYQYTITSNKKG